MIEHLSAQQLRDEFKIHLDKWQKMDPTQPLTYILFEIQHWSTHLEKFIQKKLKLLQDDFNEYSLQKDYLHSATEAFFNIEQIMKKYKTLMDVAKGDNLTIIIPKIKEYYLDCLAPLLNIIVKLENDYISITTKMILDKGTVIEKIEEHLTELKKEKQQIENRFFEFKRKEEYAKLLIEIKRLELRRKIIRLTLHHHKLNLYYFNHDRPAELKEIKEKADKLRNELYILEKEIISEQ